MHLELTRHALALQADGSSSALAPRDAALLAWLALEGRDAADARIQNLPRGSSTALSFEQGISQIRDLTVANQFADPVDGKRGDVTERDILDAYADHVLSLIDITKLKPLKIAIDAGNGMAARPRRAFSARLPIKIVPLFMELDGTFPNHEANPLEPENIVDLQRAVVDHHCDFGVAFDGDADRMFLIDEHGDFVGGDMTTSWWQCRCCEKHPGSTICYNLICSRSVPETVARMGGKPIRTRVGHSLIKAEMRANDAIFGGEHSGHFYFRDNWYADSGMIAMLTVLELVSEAEKPLSQVLAPLDTRVRSGEINNEVTDPAGTVKRIEDHYAALGAKIDHLDGATVEFPSWWFNLRSSNTQPLLRLNIEADDSETLRREQKNFSIKSRIANTGVEEEDGGDRACRRPDQGTATGSTDPKVPP